MRFATAVLVLGATLAGGGGGAAQPSEGAKTTCADDAFLVFDGSGSMASVGYNEMDFPRIEDARAAVRKVLPQVAPYRRIGLITYGPGAKDACSNIELRIAPDYNTDRAIIGVLDRLVPDGDTPLTQSVLSAAEALSFRERPAVIVLVTDGEETCGGAPCRAAQQLVAEGLATTVHVIGFRMRDRFFSWRSQADVADEGSGEGASQCLASMTGGQFVSTETTEQLVRALQSTLGCQLLTEHEEARPAQR